MSHTPLEIRQFPSALDSGDAQSSGSWGLQCLRVAPPLFYDQAQARSSGKIDSPESGSLAAASRKKVAKAGVGISPLSQVPVAEGLQQRRPSVDSVTPLGLPSGSFMLLTAVIWPGPNV